MRICWLKSDEVNRRLLQNLKLEDLRVISGLKEWVQSTQSQRTLLSKYRERNCTPRWQRVLLALQQYRMWPLRQYNKLLPNSYNLAENHSHKSKQRRICERRIPVWHIPYAMRPALTMAGAVKAIARGAITLRKCMVYTVQRKLFVGQRWKLKRQVSWGIERKRAAIYTCAPALSEAVGPASFPKHIIVSHKKWTGRFQRNDIVGHWIHHPNDSIFSLPFN